MKGALTAEEMRACELMGMNPHEYIEARARNREEALNREAPMSEEDPEIMDAQQKVMKAMGVTPEQFRRMQAQSEAATLTGAEIEVCQKMGILPVDYLAQKMRDAGLTKHPSGGMTV